MGSRALGKILRTHVSTKSIYAYYELSYACWIEFLRGEDYGERKELRKLCSKCKSPCLSRRDFHRLHIEEIATYYSAARNDTFLYFSKVKLNLASSSSLPLGKSLMS